MGKRGRRRHREAGPDPWQLPPDDRELGFDSAADEPAVLLGQAARIAASGLSLPGSVLAALVGHPAGHEAVHRAAAALLEAAVRRAWDHGWQPADLTRRAARKLSARHERLVTSAIAADAVRYLPDDCEDRWAAQLDAVGAVRWWPEGNPFVAEWIRADRLDPADALLLVVELLGMLSRLHRLAQLCDPPGTPGARRRQASAASAADPAMLNRVRALLAKAESTTFPEEAEALAAKAQQLITRHAIDHALLASDLGTNTAGPGGRRVGIDDPYVGPKALLLAGIAEANRCKAVWSQDGGYADVFGHDEDLDAVELLFVSLLTHATASLARQGGDGDARNRSRNYRQSFLIAFAERIRERLAEASASAGAEAAAEHGERLLPVLAAREAAVEEALRAAHPKTKATGFNVRDGAGYAAGRAAADLADLGTAAEIGRRQAS